MRQIGVEWKHTRDICDDVCVCVMCDGSQSAFIALRQMQRELDNARCFWFIAAINRALAKIVGYHSRIRLKLDIEQYYQ